jgi:single-strand DNA-binding protein
MSDLNITALVGYVSYDAVLKTTQSGTKICTFGFASNRSVKKEDGTWEEDPQFFTFNLFGSRAEHLGPYLVKGQLISIVGSLRMDRWESSGEQRSRMTLVIDDLRLLGSKKKGESEKGPSKPNKGSEEEEGYFPPPEEEDADLDLGGLGGEPSEA